MECESRREGNLILPPPLLKSMEKGYKVLLYTSLENRVKRIREVYTKGPVKISRNCKRLPVPWKKRLGRARVEELNSLLSKRDFDSVFTYLLSKYYDPLYRYPDGPSPEYDLSVDTKDMEKAVQELTCFIQNLPEYEHTDLGRYSQWKSAKN